MSRKATTGGQRRSWLYHLMHTIKALPRFRFGAEVEPQSVRHDGEVLNKVGRKRQQFGRSRIVQNPHAGAMTGHQLSHYRRSGKSSRSAVALLPVGRLGHLTRLKINMG